MQEQRSEIRSILRPEEHKALAKQAMKWADKGYLRNAPLKPTFGRKRIDLLDREGKTIGTDAFGFPLKESLCLDLGELRRRIIAAFDLDPEYSLGHECFLTVFSQEGMLPIHRDPEIDVIRFVMLIQKATKGGDVYLKDGIMPLEEGQCYALPLTMLHGVTRVESGARIALAMGLRVKPDEQKRLTLDT